MEKDLTGISAVMPVVFCRRLGKYMMRHRAIMWKRDVFSKPEVYMATQSEKDRDTDTGNMQKN